MPKMIIKLTEQMIDDLEALIKKPEYKDQIRRFLIGFAKNSGRQLEGYVSDEELIIEARKIVQ
jgi:hypothetical protein